MDRGSEVKLVRASRLMHVDLDGVTVVHSPDLHQTHVLDERSRIIWDLLGVPCRVSELVDAGARLTGADPVVIEAQVATVVEGLSTKGLVRPLDGSDDEAVVSIGDRSASEGEPEQPRRTAGPAPSTSDLARGAGPIRRAGGTSVRLHSSDDEARRLVEIVSSPLPPEDAADHEIAIEPTDRSGWRVLVDGHPVASFGRLDQAMDHLRGALNQLAVDHTRDRLLFHAGAVEIDGRVAMIAGVSGAGKSTLTAALVTAGFAYLTDELVAVDPGTGAVEPYPKLFDLTAESMELLGLDPDGAGIHQELAVGKVPIDPSALGAVSDGGHLALVVLLDHPDLPSASLTVTEPVGRLIDLMDSTFAPTMRRPGALADLAALVGDVGLLRLPRMTPNEAAERVRNELLD